MISVLNAPTSNNRIPVSLVQKKINFFIFTDILIFVQHTQVYVRTPKGEAQLARAIEDNDWNFVVDKDTH